MLYRDNIGMLSRDNIGFYRDYLKDNGKKIEATI